MNDSKKLHSQLMLHEMVNPKYQFVSKAGPLPGDLMFGFERRFPIELRGPVSVPSDGEYVESWSSWQSFADMVNAAAEEHLGPALGSTRAAKLLRRLAPLCPNWVGAQNDGLYGFPEIKSKGPE